MLALLTLAVWVYLFFAHGRFWSSTPELSSGTPLESPAVDIVIPARDEADTIGAVVTSLLSQRYAGSFRIILVDDGSHDGTAAVAVAAAAAAATATAALANFEVLSGRSKPEGWSGKLWALDQGVAAGSAPLLLFVDADIVHDPSHLATLVSRIETPRVDMVSEMVRLNCASRAERLLVPAFVYFFQMLYPFAKVNDPTSGVAAAAGGTVLIRRDALQRIGGIAAIRGALIDDVTLAGRVKLGGAIYLGHSTLATSLRPYPRFRDIWDMISRTAFTQLRHSAALLACALFGMALVWWAPLAVALLAHGWQRLCGVTAVVLGAVSYCPTLRRYGRSLAWVSALPVIASFYMAATLGSAFDHWRGSGARWKGRDYKGAA